jgi:putative transposase
MAVRSLSRETKRSTSKLGEQPQFAFRTWGGQRVGAGRKPWGGRARVAHVARPEHRRWLPVHVTLRAARGVPSLRNEAVFRAVRHALARASGKTFDLVHFSVQTDHVHLLVESADKGSLSRGTSGLSIRLARAVNRVIGRRGHVWGDRYHARALYSPREVRNTLVYVLMNWRKHVRSARGFDPCTSAFWFDGWKGSIPREPPEWDQSLGCPVVPSRTWLGSRGWKRHGLIDSRELPKGSAVVAQRPPP